MGDQPSGSVQKRGTPEAAKPARKRASRWDAPERVPKPAGGAAACALTLAGPTSAGAAKEGLPSSVTASIEINDQSAGTAGRSGSHPVASTPVSDSAAAQQPAALAPPEQVVPGRVVGLVDKLPKFV